MFESSEPSRQSKNFVSFTKRLRIAFHDIFRKFYDYKNDVIFGLEYRPHYALALILAAEDAKKIGIKSLKIFEFGCAGGSGLIDLQYLTKRVEFYTGVGFEIHGFDSGSGLPPSTDIRDCLYLWSDGDYPMDEEKLKSRLFSSTSLHIGDISDTLESACKSSESPIGVIFFDMDYYSSSMSALNTLGKLSANAFLPRTIAYFDDLLFTSDFTGELLAITEFNSLSSSRKISRIPHLSSYLSLKWQKWIYLGEKIFWMHAFDHELYSVENIKESKVRHELNIK